MQLVTFYGKTQYCNTLLIKVTFLNTDCAYIQADVPPNDTKNINSLPLSPQPLAPHPPSCFLKSSQALKAHPSFPVSSASASPLPSQTSQVLGLDIHTHWVAQGRARERGTYPCSECQVKGWVYWRLSGLWRHGSHSELVSRPSRARWLAGCLCGNAGELPPYWMEAWWRGLAGGKRMFLPSLYLF